MLKRTLMQNYLYDSAISSTEFVQHKYLNFRLYEEHQSGIELLIDQEVLNGHYTVDFLPTVSTKV